LIRRIRLVSAFASAAAITVLIAPGTAGASTQLGQTFEPTAPDCSPAGRTFFQTAPSQYVVPSDGVITSWSFQAGATPPQLKLKIARPQSDTVFRIVGESGVETPAASMPNTFPAQIPVSSGDVLGFRLESIGGCYSSTLDPAYRWRELADSSSDPAPGTDAEVVPESTEVQFDIGATLEADCDHDGLGDETQDPNTSSCHPAIPSAGPTGQRAAALKRCKKRAKKSHWTKKKAKKCKRKARRLPV
jgi:hypothetical protein